MADDQKTEHEETEHKEPKEDHKHHQAHEGDEASKPKGASTVALKQKLGRFMDWYKTNKKLAIPATVLLSVVIILAIPLTRYSVLALFLKQDFSVIVVDSLTGKPVSSAQVNIQNKSAMTDGAGKVSLHVAVGYSRLMVTKAYYDPASQSVTVPVRKPSSPFSVKLQARGRPIPITVVNGISGQALGGVTLSAGTSKAQTDDKGQAVLVVPVGSSQVKGTMSADGYNKTDIAIKSTTEQDQANTFKLTPSGKLYFLSNQSGKIDVVKADLDGGNRQTVLAGTGKESKSETVLLATRDWKYLALQSKRDGGDYAKLFLINTADDSLTTMDEGKAAFTLSGWDEHRFVYQVSRDKVDVWQPKRQALKKYDADTKKLTTLDETTAQGSDNSNYMSEYFGGVYILKHQVVYIKNWQGQHQWWMPDLSGGKQATLNSVSVTGGDKKVIKGFAQSPPSSYINLESRSYGVDELYLRFYDTKSNFYEYEDGKVKDLPDMTDETYYGATYATYLLSPSGKKLLWSEVRDGRNSLFIGDVDKDTSKASGTSFADDYTPYGWYTDDYALLSKKGSELYIEAVPMTQNFPKTGIQILQPVKVTDYYKPAFSYLGYGGGYGGL